MEQNRGPRNKPSYYGQMIFDKSSKTTQWGKEQSFQQMVLGELDIHLQKNEVRPSPSTILL